MLKKAKKLNDYFHLSVSSST